MDEMAAGTDPPVRAALIDDAPWRIVIAPGT